MLDPHESSPFINGSSLETVRIKLIYYIMLNYLQDSVSNLSSILFYPPFIAETRWCKCNSKPSWSEQFFNQLVLNSKKTIRHTTTGGREVSWHIQLPIVVFKHTFLNYCTAVHYAQRKDKQKLQTSFHK